MKRLMVTQEQQQQHTSDENLTNFIQVLEIHLPTSDLLGSCVSVMLPVSALLLPVFLCIMDPRGYGIYPFHYTHSLSLSLTIRDLQNIIDGHLVA